jgi:SAM-dependent methyltransferase
MNKCLRCDAQYEGTPGTCEACGRQVDIRDGFPLFAPELAESDEFYSAFFPGFAEMGATHFWYTARNRIILWALKRHFPDAPSFFEIGCGPALVLSAVEKQFPAMSLAGSDVFISGLALAKKRVARATLYQMDARRIPFHAQFSVLAAFDVLEHIKEDETVLRQMYDAAQPGGGVMITVPQHPFLWGAFDDYSHHVRRYTRPDLVAKLERAGFVVELVTSFISLLFPLVAASRIFDRVTGMGHSPKRETAPGPALNIIFGGVMAMEFTLIRAGARLPFGVSLLAVARKR